MTINKLIRKLLLGLFLIFSLKGHTHEMRPAYLQIKQKKANQYEVLWKIPRVEEKVIGLKPVFPSWFKLEQKIPSSESGTGALFIYQVNTNRDIHGMPISIKGIETTMVDVLVQVDLLNGEQFSMMLQPDNKNAVIPQNENAFDVIKGYFLLGVEHILSGIDHLLFVLALLLITKGGKKLFITVTAFTLAHSITLSLSALGYVGLPGPPVEAVIALSIVFLAVEIIREQQGIPTLTSKKPWLVAFTFGLLHGSGFASALAAVGLPQQNIPLALGFFNVGVEVGQILFILVAMVVIKLISIKKEWPYLIKKIPAYSIGSLAAFWLIERVVSFWN